MNHQHSPERSNSRKRSKLDPAEESTQNDIKKIKHLQTIMWTSKFFIDNKNDLAKSMKFEDTLENHITKTLESCLFEGKCDVNGTIKDRLLHKAIKEYDSSFLKTLLNHGIVKNLICNHEIPPLFQFVARASLRKYIKLFHEAGVSFENQKTKSGKPLLHFTLEQGIYDNFIKELLIYGAELSAKDSNNLTPLHHLLTKQVKMSNNEKSSYVKLLLKFGANPNSRSRLEGDTPLHTAVRNKNPQAVQQLLLYGADVNLKNANNDTAFQLAARYHEKSEVTGIEDYICCAFVKHINWLKLNREKDIDKQLLRQKIITKYKHTKIDFFEMKEMEQFTIYRILVSSENRISKEYHSGKLDISPTINVEPFKCWKRILRFRVKRARQRLVLLSKCKASFMQFSRLPSTFVRRMLKFLSTTDLRSFYAALRPESFMEKLEIEPVKLSESDDEDESSSDELSEEEENDDDSSSE